MSTTLRNEQIAAEIAEAPVIKPHPAQSLPPADITLLTIPQAAAAMQVSRRTVEYLIADGAVETIHIGKSVRIQVIELKAFLARLKTVRAKRADALAWPGRP